MTITDATTFAENHVGATLTISDAQWSLVGVIDRSAVLEGPDAQTRKIGVQEFMRRWTRENFDPTEEQ